MRIFSCHTCSNLLFFENNVCLNCKSQVGFDPGTRDLLTLPAAGLRKCSGGDQCCNWLVAESDPEPRCLSCRTTVEHPAADGDSGAAWTALERAKRRLCHTLLRLGLSLDGMTFAFKNDGLTGHADGLISVVLAEADDAVRMKRQHDMGEPFRTLSGHLRHESGHFYHTQLVLESPHVDEIRAVFGDERTDYAKALEVHYKQGPPADWSAHHVSAYASSHPHEDWAETWAHYLHMVDALEIASAYGLSLAPRPGVTDAPVIEVDLDVMNNASFDDLIAAWQPLTWFANSLNRSLGHPDWYPFAPSPAVMDKLRLVHALIMERSSAGPKKLDKPASQSQIETAKTPSASFPEAQSNLVQAQQAQMPKPSTTTAPADVQAPTI